MSYSIECFDSSLELIKSNDRYEWGFDLTKFRNVKCFKSLLYKFRLKLKSDKKGFHWQTRDDTLIFVTANNPITGFRYNQDKSFTPEKGYLSYVGVSCKSPELLIDFIRQFRKYASYIKEEANGRDYI